MRIDIPYVPMKIDVRKNQIYRILTMEENEIQEIKFQARTNLYNELKRELGDTYTQQAKEELELIGTPTEEEIRARVASKINRLVDMQIDLRIEKELGRRMKFELEPNDYAALEFRRILKLGKGLEIIERKGATGTTVYYRDKEHWPSSDKADNLLSLSHYKSER